MIGGQYKGVNTANLSITQIWLEVGKAIAIKLYLLFQAVERQLDDVVEGTAVHCPVS